ncbi:L-idonate 5-dehydrogenase [uncultured Boseongicola sp.]|jgi:L-idonate 5-dehydrogenase|uniref:L-idonate 5-dehydrogenase n=1 Tax=uncultured Boseongicola sp. TaxID=1648499 RepID=UPI0026245F38|nr:L-idonate 5-dehydrogenase [uncultured Boseongicola sp.]
MKAIVIHAAHDLRLEDRDPRAPMPGEVRVAIKAGGICGSDLHYYHQGGFGPIRIKEPMILGHEVSGLVTDLGSGVAGLSIGQLVAVSPSRPCQACQYCLKGMQNHCENMAFYGSAMPFPHIQGAFRQDLIALPHQCVPADGLTSGEAAMAEPLAVCLHAVHHAGDLVGKSVLVSGCGPIGLLSVLAARRAGASEIIATDLTDFTLAKALEIGADHALNLATDPDALTPWQSGKGQIDVQFECSGAAQAVAAGVKALRPQGILVQLGLGGDMTLPMQAMTAKEIVLKGSFRFHDEFTTAVQLMQKGLIDVAPLITQTFCLADAVKAFDTAGDRTQAVKAQIDFT